MNYSFSHELLIFESLINSVAYSRILDPVSTLITPLANGIASRFQIPFLEFLRRRAELAELVNGRARGREGERLKRFGQHLVEVFPEAHAGGDVRIEMLAGSLRHERRNVLDQDRVDDRIIVGVVTNAPMGPVSTINGLAAQLGPPAA